VNEGLGDGFVGGKSLGHDQEYNIPIRPSRPGRNPWI